MREKEGGKGERNIERERSENGGRREKREMVVRRKIHGRGKKRRVKREDR